MIRSNGCKDKNFHNEYERSRATSPNSEGTPAGG